MLLRCNTDWHKALPGFIFRTLEDVEAAGNRKRAATGTWESRRYITRVDGFGFSLHHTIVRAGTTTQIQYKNHVEAVLVLAGRGEIEVCKDGAKEGEGEAVLKLEAGSLYGLGGQEKHFVRALEELSLVCAFSPPVDGAEDHNEEGVFPAVGEDGVALYSYGPEQVPGLFQPPRSLARGSARGNATERASAIQPPQQHAQPQQRQIAQKNVVRGNANWEASVPGFIFRTLEDVEAAGNRKRAATGTWESRRYITRVDGFGFSLHHTIVRAGTTTQIQYKNHVEAVLVLAGRGEIEVCKDGAKEGEGEAVLKLEAGSLYGLGGQEKHFVRALEELSLVCAFSPPVDGAEDHNEEGVFPAVGEDGVALYSYGPEQVPGLFQPPRSLARGSARGK